MIKQKREIIDKWKTNEFAKNWREKLENKKVKDDYDYDKDDKDYHDNKE